MKRAEHARAQLEVRALRLALAVSAGRDDAKKLADEYLDGVQELGEMQRAEREERGLAC